VHVEQTIPKKSDLSILTEQLIPYSSYTKEAHAMSRRRSVMSEKFKYELAKDLGFYDTVQQEGWGGIRTKDAGNMVKRAIQIAEQAAASKQT
jgi:small acid-soluble spore protein F (minor alpha/beta-type SASP)